ncbi:N66 matrix protein-like [Hydractinia symbiolongicarpus]|uniref:N66 matrix protein-like n=1 Tax=Hydractinia symbiolongicarpus TaxID=13093 RepID=UPI00254AC06B|nr:N66 matrix protein-like [Hydractinia symbiolongicarpus]
MGELETVSGNSLSFYGNTVNEVGLDVNNDVDDNGSDGDVDDVGDVDDDGNDGEVDHDGKNGVVDHNGNNGYSNADRDVNDGGGECDVDFAQFVNNDSGKGNLIYHVNDDENNVILGEPVDDNRDGIGSDDENEKDTINLHGQSDKGSSNNDDDYELTKQRQARKRKKLFGEDVLRKKCKRMICECEPITKSQIKDALAGTNLIK